MSKAEAGHVGETPEDLRSARRRRVAITLLGLGVLCSAAGWYTNHRAERVSAAQAQGVVVEQSARQDGDLWYVDLSYEYEVDGEAFRQRETRIVRETSGKAAALAEVGKLEAGSNVRVYFDPDRPGQGALERAHGQHWLLFSVGALWVTLGVLWIAYDRGRSS